MGCRRQGAPREFIRAAVQSDGSWNGGAQAPGRGVYVCSEECFDLAAKRGGFDRALRRPVTIAEVHLIRAKMFG